MNFWEKLLNVIHVVGHFLKGDEDSALTSLSPVGSGSPRLTTPLIFDTTSFARISSEHKISVSPKFLSTLTSEQPYDASSHGLKDHSVSGMTAQSEVYISSLSSGTGKTESHATVTGHTGTGSSVSGETETGPTVTDPTETGPTVTDQTTNHTETGPTVTDPTTNNQTETGPTVTDPTTNNHTETGPTVTNPTETGPTVTNPTETGPTATGTGPTATGTGHTATGHTATGTGHTATGTGHTATGSGTPKPTVAPTDKPKLSRGAVAGIVIGCLLLVAVITAAVVFFVKNRGAAPEAQRLRV